MLDPQYEQVIMWAGLAFLALLCLPLAAIQKLILEVWAWALRLAFLALLGGGAYLWFRPQELPAEVTDTLNMFPQVRSILPDPGTPFFGICAASLVVVVFLPLLAVLDVTRKLAGWRIRRLRVLAAGPAVVETRPVATAAVATAPPQPVAVVRRVDRRAAADTLAQAGARRPHRPTN